jgi:thymidylate synthase (FAD)
MSYRTSSNEAKLIGYTQPVFGSEYHKTIPKLIDIIAYCARVSNPSNQKNTATSKKLISYLLKNKHFSPFEMVSVTMELITTRDIARQVLRHRSFSFQEYSQRYADPTSDLQFVTREARMQDSANRQNSIDTDDNDLKILWYAKQQQIAHECRIAYQWAISQGIAKEQARAVLPEGLMESRLYMQGTLRSWIHYIELRTGNGTQKEHKELAESCSFVLADIIADWKTLLESS